MALVATCLGFPRIGADRELKKALESFWAGKITGEALEDVGRTLRARHWAMMKESGMREVPTNDFSFYDHVLDTAVMLGAIPPRYGAVADPLSRYFAMARGLQDPAAEIDLPALEMTKWFDTNYHYIVPEILPGQAFALDASRILREIAEARAAGVEPRPVVIGPVTFLKLAKLAPDAPTAASTLHALDRVVQIYQELLATLADRVEWIQIDEPCLVLDLDGPTTEAYRRAYERMTSAPKRPKILLATYFGELGSNLDLAVRLGCDGLHVDLVRAPDQLDTVLANSPQASCCPWASSTDGTSGAPIWMPRCRPSREPRRRWAATGYAWRLLVRCCTSPSTGSSRPRSTKSSGRGSRSPDRSSARSSRWPEWPTAMSVFTPCVSRPRAPRSRAGGPRRARTTAPCATDWRP